MTQKNDLNSQASRRSCTTLRKASRRISQLYDAALAPSGLKTTQRAILAQIRRSEATTVGNLAEALVMDAGALAHTLKPLERDGLISIDVDPDDRRNRVAKLTPAGNARLSESDRLWENAHRGFEAAFGRAKSVALREAMQFLVSGRGMIPSMFSRNQLKRAATLTEEDFVQLDKCRRVSATRSPMESISPCWNT